VQALPVLDLRALLGVVASASLYVGNDGGIMHCAVALKVPTVAIMGPTEDDVWFPYARWGPYRVVRGRSQPLVAEYPDATVEEVLEEIEAVRVG
jgi:ADP-heptose:LPS heptosyltransferase